MEISNNSQSDNMIVGHCVACDGLVRIPLNANPSSTVRCPRCSAGFKLLDVLERAAPILELVDDQGDVEPEPRQPRFVPILDETPAQPETRKPGEKFVVSPILQKNSKRKRHRRRRRSSEGGSKSPQNGISTKSPVGDAEKLAEPSLEIDHSRVTSQKSSAPRSVASSETKKRPAPRRPKKSRQVSNSSSGGFELVKIVLGAALALPVAQLLIWWFAGTDPLNLGPTVSRIMPFVVPAEFQPDKQKNKDEFFESGKPITDLNDITGAKSDNE